LICCPFHVDFVFDVFHSHYLDIVQPKRDANFQLNSKLSTYSTVAIEPYPTSSWFFTPNHPNVGGFKTDYFDNLPVSFTFVTPSGQSYYHYPYHQVHRFDFHFKIYVDYFNNLIRFDDNSTSSYNLSEGRGLMTTITGHAAFDANMVLEQISNHLGKRFYRSL